MTPRTIWTLAKRTAEAFIEDAALTRGAAIAFYAITSLGPALLVVVAIAGLAYGEEAARGALFSRLSATMGPQPAAFLQDAIRSAGSHKGGIIATIVGTLSLIVTASGVFGEMQTALNAIWQAKPNRGTWAQLARARMISLLLVVALGLLLLVSVVIAAAIAAVSGMLNRHLPFAALLLEAANFLITLVLLSAVIATIFKVLPDRDLAWHDVAVGAVVTALLLTLGKVALGIYIGSSATISSYGAAGSVVATLFWIFYSAQIFLLGAEFTQVYAAYSAELSRSLAGSARPSDPASAAPGRPSPRAG
ncbi:MAG TPA: YihY/virulence factor BrkB family protein [Acetobacteraceae bacterium]|jgi:membrane protein